MKQNYIPFSSLPNEHQLKVWALADSLVADDCLPLVRYLGDNAPVFYQNVKEAISKVPDDHRIKMISEYWGKMQKVPFIASFVLGY